MHVFMHINWLHVFKMSTLSMRVYFESFVQHANDHSNDASFDAVPSI